MTVAIGDARPVRVGAGIASAVFSLGRVMHQVVEIVADRLGLTALARSPGRRRRAMILRRTAAYLWPYRWRVGLALVQVALISALELLKPWPLQIVIDSVLGGRPAAWARARRPAAGAAAGRRGDRAGADLRRCSAGIAVWNNYTTISIGQGMVNDLRSRLYAHLQRAVAARSTPAPASAT